LQRCHSFAPQATPEIQLNERLCRRLEGNPMARWGPRAIDLANLPPKTDEIDLLDDTVKDVWELISITNNNVAYLRREVADPADAPADRPTRRRRQVVE
jgi:hypothetical protein